MTICVYTNIYIYTYTFIHYIYIHIHIHNIYNYIYMYINNMVLSEHGYPLHEPMDSQRNSAGLSGFVTSASALTPAWRWREPMGRIFLWGPPARYPLYPWNLRIWYFWIYEKIISIRIWYFWIYHLVMTNELIFFRGVGLNHQPVVDDYPLVMTNSSPWKSWP